MDKLFYKLLNGLHLVYIDSERYATMSLPEIRQNVYV